MKIDNTQGILDFLKGNNFDILAFQEALKAHDEKVYKMYRTKNDIEAFVQDKTKQSVFAPVWGANAITRNGEVDIDFGGFVEQGCFLMSKHEIMEHRNQFYHLDYKDPGFDATNFKRDDHARSIQNAILDINGKKVRIINIHGIWNEGKTGDARTLKQCQFIIDKALETDYPTITVGDFNLLPNSESIGLMNRYFRNLIAENNIESTRPQDVGSFVCDYIFVNDKVKVNSFEVLDNDVSDHLPLVLDFNV